MAQRASHYQSLHTELLDKLSQATDTEKEVTFFFPKRGNHWFLTVCCSQQHFIFCLCFTSVEEKMCPCGCAGETVTGENFSLQSGCTEKHRTGESATGTTHIHTHMYTLTWWMQNGKQTNVSGWKRCRLPYIKKTLMKMSTWNEDEIQNLLVIRDDASVDESFSLENLYFMSRLLLPLPRLHYSPECSRDFPVVLNNNVWLRQSPAAFPHTWKENSRECPDPIVWTFSCLPVQIVYLATTSSDMSICVLRIYQCKSVDTVVACLFFFTFLYLNTGEDQLCSTLPDTDDQKAKRVSTVFGQV